MRYFIVNGSVMLLVTGLLGSPFVHVHSQLDDDHAQHPGATNTTVHAHLPVVTDSDLPHGLSVEESRHGETLDLFLLAKGKAPLVVALGNASSNWVPAFRVVSRLTMDSSVRARDPAFSAHSSRGPPA